MKGRIYLDYAATTPVDPRVWKGMPLCFYLKKNKGKVYFYFQKVITLVLTSLIFDFITNG